MTQKRVFSIWGLALVLAVGVGSCNKQEDGAQAARYLPLSEFQEDGQLRDMGFLIRGRIRSLEKRPIGEAIVSLYDSREPKTGQPGERRQSAASNERDEY